MPKTDSITQRAPGGTSGADGWTGPLTLSEVFDRARADGYTHAGDDYTYRGRKLDRWATEIATDMETYEYHPDGAARQVSEFPSNAYRFWSNDPAQRTPGAESSKEV